MKTSRKKICRICFAVIVVITFVLWCIWFIDDWKHDVGDDIFPAHFMAVEFGCIFLAIPIVQEFIVYKSVSYFWATEVKTPRKTCLYIVLLIIDLAFLVHEAIIFLALCYQTLFG